MSDPYGGPDATTPLYVISVAAQLTGLHPQTLRTYERLGLITPGRAGGGGRRYSHRDVELLRSIAGLTASGIGIEGVRRILDLEHTVTALTAHAEAMQAELEATRTALAAALAAPVAEVARDPRPSRLPVLRGQTASGAVVVWRRGR